MKGCFFLNSKLFLVFFVKILSSISLSVHALVFQQQRFLIFLHLDFLATAAALFLRRLFLHGADNVIAGNFV